MARATIGIDCRLGGVRHGGIGRYISEYVRHAVASDELQFSLIFSDEAQRRELLDAVSLKKNSHIQTTIANIRHYSLSEQLRLPSVYNRLNFDLLHVPHFNVPIGYRRPFIVTIHDLLWHSTRGTSVTTLPAWQYWFKYGAYRLAVGDTIKRAARIFTPTRFVADTITSHYPSAVDKIVVTYEGVGAQFVPSLTATKNPKQLLYVGSLYPHKNVGVLAAALQLLPDYRLAIVTARDAFADSFRQHIKELGLQDRVAMHHGVPDTALVQWYQSSGIVIQPSTSEGFGLTGLEALACGAPLIASDIAVFHEVYGDAAFFFDPYDAKSLVAVIKNVALQKNQSSTARAEILARYSWKVMTELIIKEIKQLV